MVGSGAFVEKPVALFNASSRAVHARDSLKETLTMMSALVVENAYAEIDLIGSQISADEIAADPQKSALLRSALSVLCDAAINMRVDA